MTRNQALLLAAIFTAVGSCEVYSAGFFTGPFGPGGTYRAYEFMPADTWANAQEQATESSLMNVPGHLVSFSGPLARSENDFVHSIARFTDNPNIWIGLTDREGAARQVIDQGVKAPQESHTFGDDWLQQQNRWNTGWAWTSGEPFDFINWGGDEPNNMEGVEDAVLLRGDGKWRDVPSGFAENEPVVPTLQNGTSPDETAEAQLRPYVIEYPINSRLPITGAMPSPSVFPRQRLAGRPGTTGNWSVVDYYEIGDQVQQDAVKVIRQIQEIESGSLNASSVSAELPILDVADPDTNAEGGPFLGTDPTAFPSNTPNTDDDNFISVAHARFQVKQAGQYTINITADEGFAMRIFGASVLEVSGDGLTDPLSPDTFQNLAAKPRNMRALYDLKVGEYTAEFVAWEQTGDALYEVTAALGNHLQSGITRWLPFGDPAVLPQEVVMPAEPTARLTGPLEVRQINLQKEDQIIEIARDLLLEAENPHAFSNDATKVQFEDDVIASDGCPFGRFNHDGKPETFPITEGPRDNFGTLISGEFEISDGDLDEGETLPVLFHMDANDAGMLHVIGRNFEQVHGGELETYEGDRVIQDDSFSNSCNADFTGLIELSEGTKYDFEVVHVDRGADAGLQLLAGIGNDPSELSGVEFTVVSMNAGDPIDYPRNVGFKLVAEPADRVAPTFLNPCDLDLDGQVSVADINILLTQVVSGENILDFDFNGDGNVNAGDVRFFVEDETKLHSWLGDANLDGEFNSSDLVQVFQAGEYEDGIPGNSTWEDGDWNGNREFDSGDLVAAFQSGGFERGPQAGVSVPEVVSFQFSVFSFQCLLFRRTRRKLG